MLLAKSGVVCGLCGLIFSQSVGAILMPVGLTRLWQDLPTATTRRSLQNLKQARHIRLDIQALRQQLQAAHLRRSAQSVFLPMPDGSDAAFQIRPQNTLSPALAKHYPEILSFSGYAITDPATIVQLDISEHGFSAQILDSKGQTIYIRPEHDAQSHYLSYFKHQITQARSLTVDDRLWLPASALPPKTSLRRSATTDNLNIKITYRLAVAATGEFSQFYNADKAQVLSAIVSQVNQLNQIYERDLGVRLELVENTEQLIYLNPETDPYTAGDLPLLLEQNQLQMDQVIGSENYDIGHVFTTEQGGLAGVGTLCSYYYKAYGLSGCASPTDVHFAVDVLAHEIGHQFGATHTYNGSRGACSQRYADTAYEPGSGSTIMSYPGLCAQDNLQNHAQSNFHSASLAQIRQYILQTPENCGRHSIAALPLANPVASPVYVIPRQTPFMLSGNSEVSQQANYSYSWEQWDLGSTGQPLLQDIGSGPLFRAFPPTQSAKRSFPQMNDVLYQTTTTGEILPSTRRSLNFRLIARDNQGSAATTIQTQTIEVSDQAGPFRFSWPNRAVQWQGGSIHRIRWDVANTNQAPVSCEALSLMHSDDGGLNFNTLLADYLENEGSTLIRLPTDWNYQHNRLRLSCVNNLFFAVNPVDFHISPQQWVDGLPRSQAMVLNADPQSTSSLTEFVLQLESNQGQRGNDLLLDSQDQVQIAMKIDADLEDINQAADTFILMFYANTAYQFTPQGLLMWDAKLENLIPIAHYPALQASTLLDIYQGSLSGVAGHFLFFTAYRLTEGLQAGKLVYNQLPLSLQVQNND